MATAPNNQKEIEKLKRNIIQKDVELIAIRKTLADILETFKQNDMVIMSAKPEVVIPDPPMPPVDEKPPSHTGPPVQEPTADEKEEVRQALLAEAKGLGIEKVHPATGIEKLEAMIAEAKKTTDTNEEDTDGKAF